jgi:hypothetical protein
MKNTVKLITILSILCAGTVALATDNEQTIKETVKQKKSSYFFILDPRTWNNIDSNRSDDFCPLFLDY